MPGSSYKPIAKQMAMWICKLTEANINCKAGQVMRDLFVVQLQDDEQSVSLDV